MEDSRQKNYQFDEFFRLESQVYRVRNKYTKLDENLIKFTVLCNDVEGFVDTVLEKRGREWCDNILFRLGMDGGGGFFKILMSIFNKDDPYPHASSSISKRYKESGVRKVFVLAIVPNISEYYVNIKKLWVSMKLRSTRKKYTIVTDLKIVNMVLGLMSHSSCHPCSYCDVHKDNHYTKGKKRTLSNLMELFWNFFEAGCGTEDAKHHGNVVHPPLINEDLEDDTPVIEILPPPELHLMTGPTNTMLKALQSVWPRTDTWLKSINVKKTDYHGGHFTGNDCRKLLKNVEKMENPSEEAILYREAYKVFNDVVTACYGDQLSDDYVSKIQIFASRYNSLQISIIPKVHVVVFHIKEFCSLTGRGLAPYSEETGESLHHDFDKTWKKFEVRKEDSPIFGENLVRPVREYNGKHL